MVQVPNSPRGVNADELARFRAGESDGVQAVYRAYAGMVFAVARRQLGSSELAEEATQQTFVKAWRAAASFDPGRELGPWLATITRRTAIDIHRREARRKTVTLESTEAIVVELPDHADTAYDVWEIRAAIDELAPAERDIVRLMHLDQLTQVEVANRLNIPLGTVKSRSHRAHRQLAARLGHLRE